MKKQKLITLLCLLSISTICLMGCGKTKDNGELNPEIAEKLQNNTEMSEIDKIDAMDIPVEEKYEMALALIDMDDYIESDYPDIEGHENAINITPDTAIEMFENGESFLLLNTRSDCRFCKYVHPGAIQVLGEKFSGNKIYVVSTDYFRFLYPTSEDSEFSLYVQEKHKKYQEIFDFTGVPNLRYVGDKTIKEKIANPLSSEFFDDNLNGEEKEIYLDGMKMLLEYSFENVFSNNDIQGSTKGNGSSVTIQRGE